MFGYIVFAAIVLFQTEIRRALVHLRAVPRSSGIFNRPETTDETIEEVVVALRMLAEQRDRAPLWSIEREIGLRNYVESGIPARRGRSATICWSACSGQASPLHDGAVIIQQDRVAAAACFLPLTVNPRESAKDLGSRHRAAIGLSEETDADRPRGLGRDRSRVAGTGRADRAAVSNRNSFAIGSRR